MRLSTFVQKRALCHRSYSERASTVPGRGDRGISLSAIGASLQPEAKAVFPAANSGLQGEQESRSAIPGMTEPEPRLPRRPKCAQNRAVKYAVSFAISLERFW